MKYKKEDRVILNDQRHARVIDSKEGNTTGNEPRYYVAYLEGGGRGWWPESTIVGKVDDTVKKTAAPSEQSPAPANSKSFGQT